MGTSCWAFATASKAGIHTDSPPEPYCPVPPWPCHPREGRDPPWRWIPAFAGMTTSEHRNKLLEFCDTLDPAWERVVGVLRQSLKR
ncbi:hypothetical protein [Endozoicomonas sp. 8E]|uniref:hypothetical protein n=1 Tax=Endozoicomonas sp. 8E TaxID=3035692 RepID=UPI0029394588|nr:hypothetical protein [Endozoicomonas sp. 8E]WOG29139.1 hypothetical protein P6910_05595 [Endozoicomonas sp. 8E]